MIVVFEQIHVFLCVCVSERASVRMCTIKANVLVSSFFTSHLTALPTLLCHTHQHLSPSLSQICPFLFYSRFDPFLPGLKYFDKVSQQLEPFVCGFVFFFFYYLFLYEFLPQGGGRREDLNSWPLLHEGWSQANYAIL